MALFRMIIFIVLHQHSVAQAEYRAFRLKIVNTQTQKEYEVLSDLDHLQYRQYHPLLPVEHVSLIETWKCKGNTSDFTPICPNPKAQ